MQNNMRKENGAVGRTDGRIDGKGKYMVEMREMIKKLAPDAVFPQRVPILDSWKPWKWRSLLM